MDLGTNGIEGQSGNGNENDSGDLAIRNVACVLGLPIDIVTLDGVIDQIENSVRTGRRLFISTVNLNFIALAHDSAGFRDSLHASDICTADGIAVLALCRMLGIRLPERVAGSDFIAALSQRAPSRQPVSVFFFGGTEEAGPKACDVVNRQGKKHLSCTGSHYPGFASVDEMSTTSALDSVNRSNAGFLIVSLGAKKGQAWIMRNLAQIDAPVVSHLGAAINFLAGTVRRAPRIIQMIGMEWLWRIFEEPHLFMRYVNDGSSLLWLIATRALPLVVWQIWRGWRWRKTELKVSRRVSDSGEITLELSGAMTQAGAMDLQRAAKSALGAGTTLTLDFAQLKWIDVFGMGTLLVIKKMAADRQARLQMSHFAAPLLFGLKLNGLQDADFVTGA